MKGDVKGIVGRRREEDKGKERIKEWGKAKDEGEIF
jgi:hypothetical protein